GENNITVKATLSGLDSANLIAALPVELPESLRDLKGKVSGDIEVSGLPDNSSGSLNLAFGSGSLSGRNFDDLRAGIRFSGTSVIIDSAQISASGGN
ncbi:hypothetical protein OFM36_31060, partial [Escherichia coli]|nr:hypothetical protein [Escherichia coli]